MRVLLPVSCLIALTVCLAGCGGGTDDVATYESYFGDIVSKADDITAEFESIKNDQTAMVAVDNIVNKSNDLAKLLGEANKLPKVGTAAGLELKKKYEDHWHKELEDAFKRLRRAANAAQKQYGRHPAMLRVAQRMKNLRSQIEEFENGFNEAMGIE